MFSVKIICDEKINIYFNKYFYEKKNSLILNTINEQYLHSFFFSSFL